MSAARHARGPKVNARRCLHEPQEFSVEKPHILIGEKPLSHERFQLLTLLTKQIQSVEREVQELM